jgi:hypothetical protein
MFARNLACLSIKLFQAACLATASILLCLKQYNMHTSWQAASDGCLATLFEKIGAQPQVLTAYAREAPVRNKALLAELLPHIAELKVRA